MPDRAAGAEAPPRCLSGAFHDRLRPASGLAATEISNPPLASVSVLREAPSVRGALRELAPGIRASRALEAPDFFQNGLRLLALKSFGGRSTHISYRNLLPIPRAPPTKTQNVWPNQKPWCRENFGGRDRIRQEFREFRRRGKY